MKRTMILPMIVVSKLWFVAAVAAADSFPITSPQQTDRSVMLAWETHQEVRTVRNSCQWNPSTPTGRTHDAAIVPGQGRGGSAAARIQGNRSEGNARGCFVQELVDDVKYNSSPDITWHNGCLVYVYNKFEHLYGGRNDPGRLYGCFIARLRPTVD